MRSSKTSSRSIIFQTVAGVILGIDLAASHAAHAQTTEDLKKGQTLIVRLVTVSVNATTRELETLTFEEPLVGRRWRAPGCRMRLADHPYLQQAFERGFLLRIQSETTSSCIRTYEIGREESLIAPKAASPLRTPTLTITATGGLAPRAAFTEITILTQTLTVGGTGHLSLRPPFAPITIRSDTLTLTGTGSR